MKNIFGIPMGPFCPDLRAFFVAGPQPDHGANDQTFKNVSQSEKEQDDGKSSISHLFRPQGV